MQVSYKAEKEALQKAAAAERAAAEAAARTAVEGRLTAAVEQGRLLRTQLQESAGALHERDAALQVILGPPSHAA